MKQVIFIGQAPARPGSKHSIAGMYLRPWLYTIGLTEAAITEHMQFYALISTFPGSTKAGHARPTPEQVLEHRPVLIKAIRQFQPDIIVPVGVMATNECLPGAGSKLNEIIGKSYTANPFNSLDKPVLVIPLPHPSGRSTWLSNHNDLLNKALVILKNELNL